MKNSLAIVSFITAAVLAAPAAIAEKSPLWDVAVACKEIPIERMTVKLATFCEGIMKLRADVPRTVRVIRGEETTIQRTR